MVLPHQYRTYLKDLPGYDGFPGKVRNDTTGLALYNLYTGPGETLDLREKFPEVVKTLLAVAEGYRESLGDDLAGREGTKRRPPASVKK